MNHIWMIPAHAHNFEIGRRDNKITTVIFRLLVGTLDDADTAFTSESRLASAHYGVFNEIVHKYVDEGNTAFHTEPYEENLTSIGVVVGKAPGPVSDITYQTISQLLSELTRKYGVSLDEAHILVRHSEIPEEEKLNVVRIINDTKELNPQTLVEKLKIEKDKLQELYNHEKGRNDIDKARHMGEVDALKEVLENKEKEINKLLSENSLLFIDKTTLDREVNILEKSIETERQLFSKLYQDYITVKNHLKLEQKKGIITLLKERVIHLFNKQ